MGGDVVKRDEEGTILFHGSVFQLGGTAQTVMMLPVTNVPKCARLHPPTADTSFGTEALAGAEQTQSDITRGRCAEHRSRLKYANVFPCSVKRGRSAT